MKNKHKLKPLTLGPRRPGAFHPVQPLCISRDCCRRPAFWDGRLQCPSLTMPWPPSGIKSGEKQTVACAASSPLPQPCTPEQGTEESHLQSPGFKATAAGRQGHPSCCRPSQAHLRESAPTHAPFLPHHPQKSRQTSPACPGQSDMGHSLCFPTKQPLSHPGNRGEPPMGTSRVRVKHCC